MGLALVWRVVGSPSLLVAQLYHAAFFYALAVLTYLVGRKLYGRRGGLWAWVIIISIPMNLLFGMVFYLEVPLLAFTAAALYALLRRRAVVMGLALAGMFLTKTPSAWSSGRRFSWRASSSWAARGAAACCARSRPSPCAWWPWRPTWRGVTSTSVRRS